MTAKAQPPRPSPFQGYDINHHYRTGSAPALLAEVRKAVEQDATLPANLAVFVGAAARRDPELAAGVRALCGGAQARGRLSLDAILREAEGPPARGSAHSAEGLDARWSEFFATGDLAPLREIVAVACAKDRLREHIEGLLRERRWTDFLFGAKRRAELVERLRPLGIRVDLDRATVENAADLDAVIMRKDFAADEGRVKALQRALPRPLTAPELTPIAVKASAIWSLNANGLSHDAVVDACLEALPGADARARLSLLGVLANARLARGKFAEALALAEETLSAVPDDERAMAAGQQAREGLAVDAAWTVLDGRGEPTDDPAALRERARRQSPEAYRVLADMRSADRPGDPQRRGLVRQLDATLRGDRVHCLRCFWDEPSGTTLADEWITIPPVQYENPGLWVRVPPEINDREVEVRTVRRGSYAALLAQPPSAAERLVGADGALVALRYDGVDLPVLPDVTSRPESRAEVTVWLRESDSALVGAVVRSPAVDDREAVDLVRTIFVYGAPAHAIEAPASFLDATKGEWTKPGG